MREARAEWTGNGLGHRELAMAGRAAVLLALVVMLVACSASTDPCGLLTVDELEAEMGVEFASGHGAGAPVGPVPCWWTSRDLSLTLEASDSFVNWDWMREQGARDADGLGEEALFSYSSGGAGPARLVVRVTASSYLNLGVLGTYPGSESDLLRALTSLARLAIGRL